MPGIRYTDNLDGITARSLSGFFVEWPWPPSAAHHLGLLRASYRAVLAVDEESGRVVGFISAISDGILSAYVPLLEVLPEFQGQGIGSELMRRILDLLSHLYMVDLCCDPELKAFYENFGMRPLLGMGRRRPEQIPD